MDVVKAVETYVNKLVSTPSSMKVLLLDTHTVRPDFFLLRRNATTISSFIDPHCLTSSHTVNTVIAPSLLDGPDRQQESGTHAAHEVRLLFTNQ
jgi:hypothetical protein